MRTKLISIVAGASIVASAVIFKPEDKVEICHYPPGNVENPQSISVDLVAVPSHVLLHGDTLGKCGYEPEDSTQTISR
ncbi:MAG: hypothetical protein ACWA42_01460 [Lutibacter sp.]